MKMSSISGRGTASCFVITFSWWKSTQNLYHPSFFSTITIGKLQGDLDLSIIPESSISFTASSTNFLLWIGVLCGFNLIARWSPVSILISTIFFCSSTFLFYLSVPVVYFYPNQFVLGASFPCGGRFILCGLHPHSASIFSADSLSKNDQPPHMSNTSEVLFELGPPCLLLLPGKPSGVSQSLCFPGGW